MEQYNNLMKAVQILAAARHKTVVEYGSMNNPAWAKLWRINCYLMKQVNDLLYF